MAQQPRPPKKPTPERLRRRALHYLERFATSRAHLRFVLLRRAGREAAHHEIADSLLAEWVDQLLVDLERIGLLNDRLYGEQLFARLSERGLSRRLAGQKLRQKGIPGELIDTILAGTQEDGEQQAAMALARRKRIGPWRQRRVDDAGRRKELAILARAGFPYAIARDIVEADEVGLDI